jgi:serine protease Do
MNMTLALLPRNRQRLLALICSGAVAGLSSWVGFVNVGTAAETETQAEEVTEPATVAESRSETRDVTIEPAEMDQSDRNVVPWLGVSTAEAPEALTSQLNLQPGVGLVVTFVATNSPAAKAGLQKNDVLIEFTGQALVHPAQLRKLVRVQKEDDTVKLAYYRAGKRSSVSVALGRASSGAGSWDEHGHAGQGNLGDLHQQLQDLHIDETVRQQMRALRESLGNIRINQQDLQQNIRRGMDEARKAIHEAMRNVTNSEPLRKVLENLARSGVVLDDKANVVVRSSGKNVTSVVKSDDNGTLVLISNPRLYVTAHDKEGKLLFDGPIETEEERANLPQELRDRVEPLLEQMHSGAEPPEAKAGQ